MPGMLAALTYLRGSARWRRSTPCAETSITAPGARTYNVDAVIYGHSHQPKIETKNGTLFFNPGSAGPRRFGLPITVGRMTAEHGKLCAEIVELSVER
jgi:predicted phosphodiesterase